MKHIKKYPSQETIRELFKYMPDGHLIRLASTTNPRFNNTIAGFLNKSNGYMECKIGKGKYSVHRLIWIYHHGDITKGMVINHINEDRADNRIENLEVISNRQNCLKSSRFKCGELPLGVIRNKNKKRYIAQITHKGIHYNLGTYDTIEEAESVYLKMVKEYHDE